MKKFLSLPEEATTNKPNYDKRFGLNQSNSKKIKNNLTDCLMRFLFFSRATFFRRCLQKAVMVVFLFFVTPLISCIDSEGNVYYSVKVSASEFEDKTDYSNIENLYKQPLHIIKKAVEGKWQLLEVFQHTILYDTIIRFEDTFIEITKDSVIATRGEVDATKYGPGYSYSYKWHLRTAEKGYSYYGMVPVGHEHYYVGDIFSSIKNDTLKWENSKLLRVKDGG